MSKLRLITVFLFAVFMVLGVTAQVHTQKGIVRKVTRSASDPFIPVQGVQVIVSGEANKASDKDGRFSLKVKVTDKAGSYTLTAVRVPQGSKYMLASPSKGKRLFISANDLEVSLITPEEKEMEYKKRYELLKEKYEEQSLSLRKLRNELNKRLGELSESDVHYARLKAECDSIRKLYLDYINNEDKIDEVIKELAEELALTDYQSLDSLELKIYELKKNGEWKALNDLIRESMPGGAEEAWKVIEQQQRNADAKVKRVGIALVQKARDDLNILVNAACGGFHYIRTLDIELSAVIKEGVCIILCNLQNRLVLPAGALEHFVLTLVGIGGQVPYVRDVHHAVYIIPGIAEVFLQHILHNIAAQVPNVGEVIDRGAAGVHLHVAGGMGFELLFFMGGGIIEVHEAFLLLPFLAGGLLPLALEILFIHEFFQKLQP